MMYGNFSGCTAQSRKLNIGIVTTWFDRGAAHVSRAYLRTLARQHNVFIYARGGEYYARGDLDWDAEYVTWGKRIRVGIPTWILWPDFRSWVLHKRLDVVLFNEQQSWDVVLRCLKQDILIGSYVDYYTAETIPFFWLYDFLICNTRRHYSVFSDHVQSLYIPWGTDCDMFDASCEPVSDSGITFIHSCGLNPYRKGTDLLVRALQHLRGDVQLIIHSQGPLKDLQLRAMISNDPRIQLIAKSVGPPGLYHLGDVYVYPSRLEGIGLTIAEALASGLPVITTNSPPMNEFVVDSVNGKLVAIEKTQPRADGYYWPESICSVGSLALAMQHYVDHQSDLPEAQIRARKYAEEHLEWDKNSATLSQWLLSLVGIMKDQSLRQATARYEYSRYPRLILGAIMRKGRSLLKRI